jgi:hypothetical protein
LPQGLKPPSQGEKVERKFESLAFVISRPGFFIEREINWVNCVKSFHFLQKKNQKKTEVFENTQAVALFAFWHKKCLTCAGEVFKILLRT